VADTDTLGPGLLALAIDKPGNLYAGGVGGTDRLPYLATSRDGGFHWSMPLMVGAPGVREAAIPGLVAGARGHVAVTYYGSKNPPGPPFPPAVSGFSLSIPSYQNETWDTYITETFNALARQPLFWSATLNDPAQPTWYGCSPSSVGVFLAPGTTNGCTSLSGAAPSLAGGRVVLWRDDGAGRYSLGGLYSGVSQRLARRRQPQLSGHADRSQH
jgi:hypothetical protein